ncbi:hypothetical protein FIE12Z_5820 [Fusarium flagelliforme]|uniref:Zn(2)-C6 fungal-type domain-containing protein n=1 Tax=Fusarium flagelliforme TaxID=2675880 RepID=A0A395MPP5_9HYPO|nr:hypothetical protein FIE12Z_5820 [Fusarium flagelliforme]
MVVSAEVATKKPKQKQYYTRSRTGCLTCRQRHQKCDERQCEYPSAVLPLRERRKKCLPGEQQPWTDAVTMPKVIGSCTSVATRPIPMAYRSDELFHYFYQLEDPFDVVPKGKRQDLLKSVSHSSDALRNTMLIAGLHYAWNAGQLQSFEPTFLFHKIQTMSDCALGNIVAAETHMDGLMRFMDLHRPPHITAPIEHGLDDELANRCVLFAYNFIHGFKSRVEDALVNGSVTESSQKPPPALVEKLMHEWHKHEMQGLDIRLKALKMLPFFFSELPPGSTFVDIDGTEIVECLATLTATSRMRAQAMDFDDQQMMWQEGAATRLLLLVVGSHIESISSVKKTTTSAGSRSSLNSSWSGLNAAAGLYLHTILRFWNAGDPIEPHLHRRVLFILYQDLEFDRRRSRVLSDLWLWKVFVGAMSLDRAAASAGGTLDEMQVIFEGFVRGWSVGTRITDWEIARLALSAVVWPEVFQYEDMARELWYSCILQH